MIPKSDQCSAHNARIYIFARKVLILNNKQRLMIVHPDGFAAKENIWTGKTKPAKKNADDQSFE